MGRNNDLCVVQASNRKRCDSGLESDKEAFSWQQDLQSNVADPFLLFFLFLFISAPLCEVRRSGCKGAETPAPL